MSIYWNWNNKLGTVECCDKNNNNYTLSVYQGNCLCVLLHETPEKNEKMFNFNTFFNDVEHLKNVQD